MPVLVITVLKFVFVGLLYFFVYRVVRSVIMDVRSSAARPARTAASAPIASAPAAATAARRKGKAPRQLVVLDERGKRGAAYRLTGPLQIGRAEACHVRLGDTYASSFHARVFDKEGAWFVEDLGSTNGTFLDQRKVTAPAELRAGDRLRIGKTTLELKS